MMRGVVAGLRLQLSRDRGFTLIELLVYSALLLLVLGLIGSLMISGIRNQARITDTTVSTSAAQQASGSVGYGVRNAKNISSPTADVPLLIVQTVSRTETAQELCQAWYYSATEKSLRTISKPYTGNAAVDRISAPTATQLKSWTLVAENVTPVTTGAAVFQTSGRTVDVAFQVAPLQGSPQIAQVAYSSRQPHPGGVSTCF